MRKISSPLLCKVVIASNTPSEIYFRGFALGRSEQGVCMTCFHPIKSYYPLETDSEGKRYLKFGRNRRLLIVESLDYLWKQEEDFRLLGRFDLYDNDNPLPIFYNFDGAEQGLNITVPCGRCIGCKLDYSRNWALRSIHEAQMHGHYKNCAFITLTFNDEMLNRRENGHSLNKVAFRSWIKRLRKAVLSEYKTEFRIMACGEYGAKHKRPHYHMLVYGFNFPDKKPFQFRHVHGIDVIYYRSKFLESVWRPAHSKESYGFSVLGDVNFESSAYVARYCTKKLFGTKHTVYKDIEPEFLTTSRMPGLGFDWLKRYYKDTFKRGFCYNHKGFKAPIPRYYVNKLKEIDVEIYNEYRMLSFNNLCDSIQERYIENLNSTQERLLVREELKKLNLDMLVRDYEINPQNLTR